MNLFDSFQPRTPAEKNEAIAQRIVKALLLSAGWSEVMWRIKKKELIDRGCMRFLNEQTGFPYSLEAVRLFHFRFLDLLSGVKKSPLVDAWSEHVDNFPEGRPALVFYVAGYGDWVLLRHDDISDTKSWTIPDVYTSGMFFMLGGVRMLTVHFSLFKACTAKLWSAP